MKCSVSVCPPSVALAIWWLASSSWVPVAAHPLVVVHTQRKPHQAVLAPSWRIGTPLPVCLLRSKVNRKVPFSTGPPGFAGAALGAGSEGLEVSDGLAGGVSG